MKRAPHLEAAGVEPEYEGRAGAAYKLTDPKTLEKPAGLASWLVYAPGQAVWSHYFVGVVHLRPLPGEKPPAKSYPQAEYELLILALDDLTAGALPDPRDLDTIHYMTPINLVHQFHGVNDDQAVFLCSEAVQTIVSGGLPVEPQGIIGARELWKTSIEASIQHIRLGLHGNAGDRLS